jgi:hypothetical protein
MALMRRTVVLPLTAVGLILILALWVGWRASKEDPLRVGSRSGVPGDTVEDLMLDLGIVPLDPQPARAFTLATLDGTRLALAEVSGRPALLYFWATW